MILVSTSRIESQRVEPIWQTNPMSEKLNSPAVVVISPSTTRRTANVAEKDACRRVGDHLDVCDGEVEVGCIAQGQSSCLERRNRENIDEVRFTRERLVCHGRDQAWPQKPQHVRADRADQCMPPHQEDCERKAKTMAHR
mmetsp:Transcript_79494/g.146198  ORF Transcript_79494/g.146198 Transcript_79494/m.146198 type:complete len:140 (+) Transcript_79494:518-937(+)